MSVHKLSLNRQLIVAFASNLLQSNTSNKILVSNTEENSNYIFEKIKKGSDTFITTNTGECFSLQRKPGDDIFILSDYENKQHFGFRKKSNNKVIAFDYTSLSLYDIQKKKNTFSFINVLGEPEQSFTVQSA